MHKSTLLACNIGNDWVHFWNGRLQVWFPSYRRENKTCIPPPPPSFWLKYFILAFAEKGESGVVSSWYLSKANKQKSKSSSEERLQAPTFTLGLKFPWLEVPSLDRGNFCQYCYLFTVNYPSRSLTFPMHYIKRQPMKNSGPNSSMETSWLKVII